MGNSIYSSLRTASWESWSIILAAGALNAQLLDPTTLERIGPPERVGLGSRIARRLAAPKGLCRTFLPHP